MLCSQCLKVADTLWTDAAASEYNLHSSLTSFQDAARAGCFICTVFWERLFLQNPSENLKLIDNTQTSFFSTSCTADDLGRSTCELKILFFKITMEPGLSLNLLDILRDSMREGSLRSGHILPLTLSNNPKPFEGCGSDGDIYKALISQLRAWLQTDRLSTEYGYSHVTRQDEHGVEYETHTAHKETKSYHPTRLLELLPEANNVVRLVDTVTLDSGIPYASLSHRWSGEDFFKCTTDTIKVLRDGVAVTDLTRTLQEAICVTRDIGIMYIWIDCLCIIQDDIPDWISESKTMTDIYNNAELTIAACAADRGTDSSFLTPVISSLKQRTMAKAFPYTISLIGPDDRIYLSSLSYRGWCLQERLLSKRIVHFVESDVVFEPSTSQSNSFFTAMLPLGEPERGLLPSRRFIDAPAMINYREPIFKGNSWSFDGPRGIVEEWFDIIEDFRRRRLTHQDDRFVAVDGVASQVAGKTGWKYYYGAWLEALPRCLLWNMSGRFYGRPELSLENEDDFESPTNGYFPSWSWASCNNMITHAWGRSGAFIRPSALVSVEPYLSSSRGALRVYGQLLPAENITQRPEGRRSDWKEEKLSEIKDRDFLGQLLPDVKSKDGSLQVRALPGSNTYGWLPDSRKFDASASELWYLPVFAGGGRCSDNDINPDDSSPDDNEYYIALQTVGLFLRKRSGALDEYVRVGLGYCNGHEKVEDFAPIEEFSRRAGMEDLQSGQSFILV